MVSKKANTKSTKATAAETAAEDEEDDVDTTDEDTTADDQDDADDADTETTDDDSDEDDSADDEDVEDEEDDVDNEDPKSKKDWVDPKKSKVSDKDRIEGRLPCRASVNRGAFNKGELYLVSDKVYDYFGGSDTFERVSSKEYESEKEDDLKTKKSAVMKKRQAQ